MRPSGRKAGVVRPSGRVCSRVVECVAEWERGRGVRPSGIGAGMCGQVGERLGCAAESQGEWGRCG